MSIHAIQIGSITANIMNKKTQLTWDVLPRWSLVGLKIFSLKWRVNKYCSGNQNPKDSLERSQKDGNYFVRENAD